MDGVTITGLVTLPIAGAGLVASVVGAAKELIDWLAARREIAVAYELAIIEDGLRDALKELERKVRYRHNLHCPKCGRFAARVPGMPDNVTNCRYHGTWLRTSEGPIEFGVRKAKAQPSVVPPLTIEPPKRIPDELDTGAILIMLRTKTCDYCEGTGEIIGYVNEFERDVVDCPECDGKGEVEID